ncbi:MAG: glycoside hydrolase family 2 [Prevotellaceae bacterium]|jgi:beta-galactosidase|nr:glycoside hydrolase family 2 [Prevotellaceae bacterium]
MQRFIPFLLIWLTSLCATADGRVPVSVAGLFPLEGSGRTLYSFNADWRFHLGEAPGAEQVAYDDRSWELVSTPHTVRLEPAEASGCRNYQGVAWYRKTFRLPDELRGERLELHFEAVMGKQRVYVNGRQVLEHLGGYLPFTIDLTGEGLQAGDTCVVALMADNSDDKNYPPGKPQYTLDFAYHGGIYRDVWLIARSPLCITHSTDAGVQPAGGGIFVHYQAISPASAMVCVDTEVMNHLPAARTATLQTTLVDADGKRMGQTTSRVRLAAGERRIVKQTFTLKQPRLWTPDTPYLYRVQSRLLLGGVPQDGGTTRIGLRKAEFRGREGFYLNDQPFGQLIGANRHQDFAYVGNALPNSQQWRDAKRLRDAGCRIIRAAHYPQDPAFMDACDELGLFVIVATPGWQFWNKDPQFAARVHANTRAMIRRDRNHPSVLLWEPILNETPFPEDFALEALAITREEYPYEGRPGAAADLHSKGVKEHYDVVYGWPKDAAAPDNTIRQSIFTREWGENVDDWYAHNCNNRASRSWGERPLLVQARSLAESYDQMYQSSGGQFTGGAQWHPFDHQRGYHPDPYWGGIYDAFRQPKYAYYLFRSQTAADLRHPLAECGPMVYIAHELSPFSDREMVVFSNCDSVRLTAYDGAKSWILPVKHEAGHMPSQPVIFPDVWDFWEARSYSYTQRNWQKVNFTAEGIIGGRVVCTDRRMPSRRSTKLRLRLDAEGKQLTADGSDFIVVVAEVTDDNGNVRRLAKENVVFTVEGEGTLIGDASIGANPRAVEFGSAPALIRSTPRAGKITVRAHVEYEGTHAPTPAQITFESIPADLPQIAVLGTAATSARESLSPSGQPASTSKQLSEQEKQRLLQEVEQQQTDFGVK